jgi:hypothetical protein
MKRETYIDITQRPELAWLADEVASTNARLILRRGTQPVVAVVPFRRSRGTRSPSAADVTVTLSSFGSWADVDTETLKRELKEARSDHRPPVEL